MKGYPELANSSKLSYNDKMSLEIINFNLLGFKFIEKLLIGSGIEWMIKHSAA